MFHVRPLLVLGALVALITRPRLRNWGATGEERAKVLPGDGLIPGERDRTTMAVHIEAAPAAVWPWLAQMGNDRAGWYSWDRLDNGGEHSAETINPAWTHIQQGDRLVSVPGRSWFDVAHVEPHRSLVLRAPMDLLGRPFDLAGPHPRWFLDSRWEFFLAPEPDGTTRLLVRSGGIGAPVTLTTIVNYVYFHPAHVIMQVRQLHQLRRRAEAMGRPTTGHGDAGGVAVSVAVPGGQSSEGDR